MRKADAAHIRNLVCKAATLTLGLLALAPPSAQAAVLSAGAAYESAEFEGGFFATGLDLQAAAEFTLYSPSHDVHITAAPALHYERLDGAADKTRLQMQTTSVGAIGGLWVPLAPRIHAEAALEYDIGLSGKLKIGNDTFAVDNLATLTHRWNLAFQYTGDTAFGIGAAWFNTSFDVANDKIRGRDHGFELGAFFRRSL